jgi:rhodanese-related sulfurtransferase
MTNIEKSEIIMAAKVDAKTLKQWLSDGDELAFLDVREHGQYGLSHPFFGVPLPYSCFELRIGALVPNPSARVVLYDDGSGVAEKATARAEALGYTNVHVLEGGTRGWEEAGYTLYSGVNVPSKTFGELVEHELDTPRIPAETLKAMQDSGEDFVLVDGRPFAEYTRFNIPGGICCPNGELALRIKDLAPNPDTKVVVNCAGRTRSIIGAQTLRDLGIPNEVVALENGTQGWLLAGLELEYDAARRYPKQIEKADFEALKTRTRAMAEARGAEFISPRQLDAWLADTTGTTYVFDVRTEEEFGTDGVPGSAHAPGGQLVQATDQWVGVRGARIVVVDSDGIRANMVASWLRQLGHQAYVLEGGVEALAGVKLPTPRPPALRGVASLSPNDAAKQVGSGAQLMDLRPSMDYRAGHIKGATWSIRPILGASANADGPVLLIADEPGLAALAATDLEEMGKEVAGALEGGPDAWRAAGLEVVETPGDPADADCIDYLFLTPERNQGNLDDARAYLAWEVGLIEQLDEQERGVFRITPAP